MVDMSAWKQSQGKQTSFGFTLHRMPTNTVKWHGGPMSTDLDINSQGQ